MRRRLLPPLLVLAGVGLILLATAESLAGMAAALWAGALGLFLAALVLELRRR
ncbi:hypothetical protein [Cellulomonas denverensis]|uniref:Uncharacterized protein n=1 Tax=Cellulomonas denverensis TaxID=264297 RepID=A0A7X6KTZ6_9CELL|nr:hypothetical protein [Cellulomonas denverensis]NKY21949.1 hypothetical protein [Cellulomonas denverensis]